MLRLLNHRSFLLIVIARRGAQSSQDAITLKTRMKHPNLIAGS